MEVEFGLYDININGWDNILLEARVCFFPDGLSAHAVARCVKREAGWTGRKCSITIHTDRIEIRPYGGSTMAIVKI